MVSINAIFYDINMWTWTRKILLSFSDKSPFSPPWDKTFRRKQQNSLIVDYGDSKNVS